MRRLLVKVLFVAALFVTALYSLHWFVDSGRESVRQPAAKRSFIHAEHANAVIEQFSGLSPQARAKVRAQLRQWLSTPPEDLITELRGKPAVVCLGERHDSETRRLIAERLIGSLAPDALMLEAAPSQVAELLDVTTT